MNRRMMQSAGALLVLLTLAVGLPAARPQGQDAERVNPHAAALAKFDERIKSYLALRDKVKASLTQPKTSEDPADITARQEVLAAGVKAARASARPGDIFTPDVAPIMRELVRKDFEQRTPKERTAALKDVPEGLALAVNDPYPKAIPLATVPPKLLAAMPPLPESLEYRFVGRRLILRDNLTNLVVDILDATVPSK